jgi:prolipoprotein diacylglyceryl transferase
VLTDWSTYFSENGRGFLAAFKIWEGGLGIWGAIALGGVGAYLAARRMDISFAPLADALAPGIVLAQAIGRWGNWFNQELFGRPTTLPWGLEIAAVHRPVGYEEFETFHPTFLYESLACIAIAAILIWADKKFVLGYGRVFALYVALYSAARGAIETLRIDQANYILGIRLNVFTALIVGAAGLVYFILSAERHPGREEVVNGKVVRAGSRRSRRIDETQSVEVIAQVSTMTADFEPDPAQYRESPAETVQQEITPEEQPSSSTEPSKERGRRRKR